LAQPQPTVGKDLLLDWRYRYFADDHNLLAQQIVVEQGEQTGSDHCMLAAHSRQTQLQSVELAVGRMDLFPQIRIAQFALVVDMVLLEIGSRSTGHSQLLLVLVVVLVVRLSQRSR